MKWFISTVFPVLCIALAAIELGWAFPLLVVFWLAIFCGTLWALMWLSES